MATSFSGLVTRIVIYTYRVVAKMAGQDFEYWPRIPNKLLRKAHASMEGTNLQRGEECGGEKVGEYASRITQYLLCLSLP